MTGFTPLAVDDHSHTQKLTGKAHIAGPQWTHLLTLTIGLLGVQIFWSVEIGYASPYLLSLGLSKPSMAIIFLAGPLSGLVMQPVIGVLADNTTSRFGRRRPWMLLGTAVCAISMLLLGYTRVVAALFSGWGTRSHNALTIALAVVAIFLIDFSINVVMAMDRALLVDTLPPAAQASGNAWAARMLGLGSVIGFYAGSIELPSLLPWLGTTQLEVLSVFVSVLLLAGHAITAKCVKERVLLKNREPNIPMKYPWVTVVDQVCQLWSNFQSLPSVIRQICMIQFFAWVAWFPQLFYTTLYIGDLYKRSTPLSSNPDVNEFHRRDAEATRLGTRALFLSSILSFFLNILLPMCVATPASRNYARFHTAKNEWWERIGIPERLKINLAGLWALSQLVLATCMFGASFVESVEDATVFISIMGFPWAVTQWAPFSLLGEAILTSSNIDSRSEERQSAEGDFFLPAIEQEQRGLEEFGLADDESEMESAILGNQEAQGTSSHVERSDTDLAWGGASEIRARTSPKEANELSAKAGIILGLHNVSIVVPQFLVTGLSAVIFAILDPVQPQPSVIPPPPKPTLPSVPLDFSTTIEVYVRELERKENSVVYIFRVGGLSALVAFILGWRLARSLRHQ